MLPGHKSPKSLMEYFLAASGILFLAEEICLGFYVDICKY